MSLCPRPAGDCELGERATSQEDTVEQRDIRSTETATQSCFRAQLETLLGIWDIPIGSLGPKGAVTGKRQSLYATFFAHVSPT